MQYQQYYKEGLAVNWQENGCRKKSVNYIGVH